MNEATERAYRKYKTMCKVGDIEKEIIDNMWSEIVKTRYYEQYAPIDGITGECGGIRWEIKKMYDSGYDKEKDALCIGEDYVFLPMFVIDDHKIIQLEKFNVHNMVWKAVENNFEQSNK